MKWSRVQEAEGYDLGDLGLAGLRVQLSLVL
jgi:hypothetical protein